MLFNNTAISKQKGHQGTQGRDDEFWLQESHKRKMLGQIGRRMRLVAAENRSKKRGERSQEKGARTSPFPPVPPSPHPLPLLLLFGPRN